MAQTNMHRFTHFTIIVPPTYSANSICYCSKP